MTRDEAFEVHNAWMEYAPKHGVCFELCAYGAEFILDPADEYHQAQWVSEIGFNRFSQAIGPHKPTNQEYVRKV